MATSSKDSRKVLEGIFAINKPAGTSSAGVLRDLQTHFQSSPLFAPWLQSQRRTMLMSGTRKRNIDNLKVKLGHGGTLDPMATGVLIVGVGKGTKCLQRFLECTKSYECVVLFGAASDSYDAVGKIVSRASYAHVTKELVEEKLEQFRGKIMQKPSIFSALKVDGKKMYEYARAGKDVPEVQARPVEVRELELVEWLAPGSHEFTWPKEEVDDAEKAGAEKLLGVRETEEDATKSDEQRGTKRVRGTDDSVIDPEAHSKKPKTEDGQAVAEPLQSAQESTGENGLPAESVPAAVELPDTPQHFSQPPAARLRMTVTSGFYVRSLCHDLGLACDSRALMSSLVRSRQGEYSLGANVLEYTDLESRDIWEPKVQKFLEESMEKEGWAPEEVEEEETWQKRRMEKNGRGKR